MTTTAQKLEQARERLARAERRAGVADDRVSLPRDPGALSGIRRSNSPRQARQRAAAVDRSIDAAVEVTEAQKQVDRLEQRLAGEVRDELIRADAVKDFDRLRPGDRIRYEQHGSPRGVGKVVRVNKTTVTLEAPWPGHDQPRIPYDRIVATVHQEDAT